MKKLAVVLVLLLALPVFAQADVDLSGMYFDDLVALREKIDLAIWNSQEWQEVAVPQGIWKVGEDIPVGHWTSKPADGVYGFISYGSKLEDNNKEVSYKSDDYYHVILTSETQRNFEKGEDVIQTDIDMKSGAYIEIEAGDVIFTPYSGKPKLGFK